MTKRLLVAVTVAVTLARQLYIFEGHHCPSGYERVIPDPVAATRRPFAVDYVWHDFLISGPPKNTGDDPAAVELVFCWKIPLEPKATAP